jgi:hypothetical protein
MHYYSIYFTEDVHSEKKVEIIIIVIIKYMFVIHELKHVLLISKKFSCFFFSQINVIEKA